jgi:hypothetical protein
MDWYRVSDRGKPLSLNRMAKLYRYQSLSSSKLVKVSVTENRLVRKEYLQPAHPSH